MKVASKLWYGLTDNVARVGAAAVVGTALLPAAFAGTGEAGAKSSKPAGDAKYSAFPGDLDKAVSNIFAGEGGEGGAGLSPMWPSVVAPALSSSDIEKVVSGNTLRTDGHFAWYFGADRSVEGGQTEWTPVERKLCPAKEVDTDKVYLGTDGICYTYKLYQSKGTWSVRDNQLCLNISWSTGKKDDCRYLTILLDDLALFDARGKIDGKGMKLLKGKSIGE
jgi:hypothetical protein